VRGSAPASPSARVRAPSPISIALLPAIAAILLGAPALGCVERVDLMRDVDASVEADAGDDDAASHDAASATDALVTTLDGETELPPDASVGDAAPAPDATRACAVRPGDPPGLWAVAVDHYFSTTGPSGDTQYRTLLIRGSQFWLEGAISGWEASGRLDEMWAAGPGSPEGDWGTVETIAFGPRWSTVIASDRYWTYDEPDGAWTDENGTLAELFPSGATEMPWAEARITGLVVDPPYGLVIAGGTAHVFRWDAGRATGVWESARPIAEWLGPVPDIDGLYPWDPPGITAYHEGGITRVVVSGDRIWTYDRPDARWETGRVSERWADAPPIDERCP
jgi:hypothetical protein